MLTALVRAPLRPLPIPVAVAAGVGLVTVATALSLQAGSATPWLVAAALVGLAGAAYLATWASASTFIALGLVATIFSGNAEHIGLPVSPDRLLFVAGVAALILRLPGAGWSRQIVWRPTHAVIAAAAAFAIASAVSAGTIQTSDGFFALLDRFGLVPFAVFALAPLLFGERRHRDALLTVLVCCGAYLSLTAIFEALGLEMLVFPRYITDPSIGIHFERARGPFAEAVANGLALYGCAVAATVARATWTDRPRARFWAGVVALLCLLGTILTLTRAVWLATVLATVVALLINRVTRRLLLPVIALGVVGVLAALVLVPNFASQFDQRRGDQRSVWDRYNTNLAAIRAVRDEPFVGIGWQMWESRGDDYLELSRDYPLTGATIEVHNVLLSHAAELGVIGVTLWGASIILAVGGGVLRPGRAELDPWRLGLVALAIHWAVVASFGPLSYAFPNLLLWAWAGVASIDHFSAPLPRASESAA